MMLKKDFEEVKAFLEILIFYSFISVAPADVEASDGVALLNTSSCTAGSAPRNVTSPNAFFLSAISSDTTLSPNVSR